MIDPTNQLATKADDVPRNFLVRVQARYIQIVAPFCSLDPAAPVCTDYIRFEPHPDGGALIIATDGKAMAVIHDREAACSHPISLKLPPHIIAACRTPDLPKLYSEGDEVAMEVPDWMVPGYLLAHYAGVHVHPKADIDACFAMAIRTQGNIHREDDYRAKSVYPKWRGALPNPANRGTGPACRIINLAYLGNFFAGFVGLQGVDYNALYFDFLGSASDAVIVRHFEMEEFFGLIMPMVFDKRESMPAWLTAAGAAAQ